ncbi:nucleoside phosphorylase [Sinomicrobium weinanense]|uniref:Uridine phosphorylase n=1 Tax=Sinomicrobium weinanense TaxID=2842200 RepID=A0A926JRT5_9FLAO|nr:nucleoside phosphorylase [Sinomicrobium weinanense]MBC9796325.1 nucleoside phosphorylase [Sinomicrobium weinanense]MBU3122473.1 nucleoside phosphorylase [Sinomicrobium weinanense]
MKIAESELMLNADGSVYHLNLRPENIASTIIFVGDQDRVGKITRHFDTVEFTTQKREFRTETGIYRGKRLSVISTGIGPDNIDIVLNELDALVNIDLEERKVKKEHTSLNIIRVGTSGALQKDIPVGAFLASSFALDLNGMLHAYRTENITDPEIEDAFIKHTGWSDRKARPLVIPADEKLREYFNDEEIYPGFTATAGGFYGPQGRVLRLPLQDAELNRKIDSFIHKELKITNLEMETSAIYGLSRLLGHRSISLNAIIANRANGTFASQPKKIVESLISYTLEKIHKM